MPTAAGETSPVGCLDSDLWGALSERLRAAAQQRPWPGKSAQETEEALAGLLGTALAPWIEGEVDFPLGNLMEFAAAMAADAPGNSTARLAFEAEEALHWLEPAARDYMAWEIRNAGGAEVSFALKPLPGGRFGEPLRLFRGSVSQTRTIWWPSMDGWLVLHNHPSGNTDPSEEDLAVAGRLAERAWRSGFGIIDSCATRLYLVWSPALPELPAEGPGLEGKLSDRMRHRQRP